MKWKLLYFDDQVENIQAFTELLSDEFNVIGCSDSTAYLPILQNHHPHAIMLDVHMPRMDGHELYQKISTHSLYNGCPVVFISGDQSDENKIKSYEGGAIDFFSRDTSSDEIQLRLKNKIKFYLQISTSLELGNLAIDVKQMKVTVNSSVLDLTLVEFRLLSNILRSFPESLTRAELIQKAWGADTIKVGTINTHISNLKSKLREWNYFIKVRDESILVQKK